MPVFFIVFFIVFFMLTFPLINQLCNQWRVNCYFLLKKIPLYGTIETESFYFGLYSSALSVFLYGEITNKQHFWHTFIMNLKKRK